MRFKMDSPLMDFIDTSVQFIGLNIIFIICCLPIITIGPALAALYQVTMKEARGEHGYIFKSYFKYFKEDFLQGFLVSLFFGILAIIIVFSFSFWHAMNSTVSMGVMIILGLISVYLLCGMVYVFPLISRYNNTTKQTIKNSFLIALTNSKYTMALLVIHLFVASMCMMVPFAKIFMLLIGFAFIALCNSYIILRVFKQYEPEEVDDADASISSDITSEILTTSKIH